MANKAKHTEHSGAKHGNGAYYGPKADAKRESNKARRRQIDDEMEYERQEGDELFDWAVGNGWE